MAQTYPRKTLKVFGNGGTVDDFEEFGSTAVAATNYTKDIPTIQGLAAWDTGWRSALVTNKAPILQDMNGVQLVHSYMTGSIFEEGIPEWDAGTTYSAGSVVKLPYTGSLNFQVFASLVDGNSNQALPTAPASNANWQFCYGFISGIFTLGGPLGFPGTTALQGIVGTVSGNDPVAGRVGEYQVARQTTFQNQTVNNQFQNLTNLSLTAGDWDVTGQVVAKLNGATMSAGPAMAVSEFSANITTDHVDGDNVMYMRNPTSTEQVSSTVANYRINLTGNQNVFLKVFVNFSAGTPQALGRISARRIR